MISKPDASSASTPSAASSHSATRCGSRRPTSPTGCRCSPRTSPCTSSPRTIDRCSSCSAAPAETARRSSPCATGRRVPAASRSSPPARPGRSSRSPPDGTTAVITHASSAPRSSPSGRRRRRCRASEANDTEGGHEATERATPERLTAADQTATHPDPMDDSTRHELESAAAGAGHAIDLSGQDDEDTRTADRRRPQQTRSDPPGGPATRRTHRPPCRGGAVTWRP